MTNPADPSRVIVSTGDPAGVSPRLLVPLVQTLDRFDPPVNLHIVGPPEVRNWLIDQDVASDGWEWEPAGSVPADRILDGDPDGPTGQAAHTSLLSALERCREPDVRGLLTLPLSKRAVREAGHDSFVGHTELLEEYFETDGLMSFFGDQFNVGLLTRHLPLSQVPEALDSSFVQSTLRRFHEELGDLFGRSPSLALLGLNPHAGEKGSLGTEDRDVLEPAVERLREEGIDLRGPAPADSFLPVHGGSVDMVVACYHDQGLTPFKLNHFFTGVHVTLGLPILRVSPDHGVAADLAGTDRIDDRSAVNSLRWLVRHGGS